MNIFATNKCPKQSAREHCYRHVVKMILESHQLLATAHRALDGDDYADSVGLMKKISNPGHPSVVWTRASSYHYKWLFIMLCEIKRINMQTKPSPKSAYHYDSDIDYYDAFMETYEEQAEAEIENGVSDEVIEQLISDNYNAIEEWLYESGRVYEYLVSYYKEQWEMNPDL